MVFLSVLKEIVLSLMTVSTEHNDLTKYQINYNKNLTVAYLQVVGVARHCGATARVLTRGSLW